MYTVGIIGGGAAGVFAALAAKAANPRASVLILEKTGRILTKVRLSGGKRCNVTNACCTPSLLIQHYPRGSQELIGPFHRFQPKDTIDWFTARGVTLKTEDDGRVFPSSNTSDTIVKCLTSQAISAGVDIAFDQKILSIARSEHHFDLSIQGKEEPLACQSLLMATGSSPEGYALARALGHAIIPPIPSLFSFSCPSSPLCRLSGICVDPVEARIVSTPFSQQGPLLITHLGFSGPCILKLSAFAARTLFEQNYRAELSINWLPHTSYDDIYRQLVLLKKNSPQKTLVATSIFELPKSLWGLLVERHGNSAHRRVNDVSLHSLNLLAKQLHDDRYTIEGKGPYKEEFVTCGGVCLKEVSFKTMESTLCPRLFFAGEILDIDGLTGGFNLQNAWTTGYIAGTSAALS